MSGVAAVLSVLEIDYANASVNANAVLQRILEAFQSTFWGFV